MIQKITPLTDDSPLPFGKHKGVPLKHVPASYLDWCIGQPWIIEWPALRDYILKNEKYLDAELRKGGFYEDDREPFGE